MGRRAFWPGYRWRVLAHKTTGQGVTDRRRHFYTGERLDLRHDPEDLCEFDELVIDDWLHLEQLDARSWFLNIGNGKLDGDLLELSVTVDGDGRVQVVRL